MAGSTNSGAGGDKTSPLAGSVDAWLVQLDSLGQVVGQHSLGQAAAPGGTDKTYAATVLALPDGSVAVFGNHNRAPSPVVISEYWLQRLDAQGRLSPLRSFQGGGLNYAAHALLAPDGGLLPAGNNWCEANLVASIGTDAMGAPLYCPSGSGDKSQPNCGFSDMWLVKTAPLVLGAAPPPPRPPCASGPCPPRRARPCSWLCPAPPPPAAAWGCAT